jgi:YVTN family beta-propeller protein
MAAPFAFLTLSDSNVVSKLDLATNLALNVPVGARPVGLAISPDGTRVYVANYVDATVSVVDVSSASVVATIPVAGPQPLGMVVTPDGGRLYVVNEGGDSVSVVDTLAGTELTTIAVSPGPNLAAINPAGTRVYVTKDDGQVAVLDTTTNVVTTTVTTGGVPYGVDVTPDGSRVYVGDFGSPRVMVIDTAANALVSTIPVSCPSPCFPAVPFVRVSGDGHTVYASIFPAGRVSVIDADTNVEATTISVGSGPQGLDLTPDGSRLYVLNQSSNSVSIVDTLTRAVVATVSTPGAGPFSYGRFVTAGVPPPTTTTTSTTLPAMCDDADADGESDVTDRCPATLIGDVIDSDGCSLSQFCAMLNATTRDGARACKKADWQNDEPLMRGKERDCIVQRGTSGPADVVCIPVQ